MKSIYWILTVILLVNCGNQVFFETSPSVNFSVFKKTYAFLPRADSTKNSLFENGIMDEHIQRLITEELRKRNYVIDVKDPDLMIRFHVMVENKEDIVNTPVYSYPGMLYGYGYRYPFYFYPGPIYLGDNQRYIRYKEGTLVIDVIERGTGKLAWRGWAVGELDNAARYLDQLPNLIFRIFRGYPVKANL